MYPQRPLTIEETLETHDSCLDGFWILLHILDTLPIEDDHSEVKKVMNEAMSLILR